MTDQNKSTEPSAPVGSSRKSRLVKGAALVGAGAIAATALTGVAMAAKKDSPRKSDRVASAQAFKQHERMEHRGGPMGPHGPGGERHGPGRMMGEPVHGETVFKDSSGAFVTGRMIHGSVTDVSADSITVKAEDDFSDTYTVASDTKVFVPGKSNATIADIKVGDIVHAEAAVKDGAAVAKMVGIPPKRPAPPAQPQQ